MQCIGQTIIILYLRCLYDNAGDASEGDCSNAGAKTRTFHERQLLNCLLHEEYDPAVRPATSSDAPVEVVVDSIVATVIDLVGSLDVLCIGVARHFVWRA